MPRRRVNYLQIGITGLVVLGAVGMVIILSIVSNLGFYWGTIISVNNYSSKPIDSVQIQVCDSIEMLYPDSIGSYGEEYYGGVAPKGKKQCETSLIVYSGNLATKYKLDTMICVGCDGYNRIDITDSGLVYRFMP